MRKLFGTDGVRGRANEGPMTPDLILKLAQVIGHRLKQRHSLVIIGKDTRLSGYLVEPALTAGFLSVGMDVVLLGPLPTPAVSVLTRSLRADLGVMISASHNPAPDNGIKFFGPDGAKLSLELEQAIEEEVLNGHTSNILVDSKELGRARRLDDAQGRYIEYAKATFPKGKRLDGLRIVVDCAHGAAYKIAPAVLWELGADVIPLHTDPDGTNINHACGATDTQRLQETVLSHRADVGLALDGDADRLVMVDETGQVIAGEHLLGAVASLWQERGILKGGGLVTTIMSNGALESFLTDQGLTIIRTPVGDKHVTEAMRAGGFNVGGEASGHLILGSDTPTGDGIVAGLQVLALLVEHQQPASSLNALFPLFPLKTRNLSLSPAMLKTKAAELEKLQDSFAKERQGRLIIRPSGTEPLIRITAEAPASTDVEWALDTAEGILG